MEVEEQSQTDFEYQGESMCHSSSVGPVLPQKHENSTRLLPTTIAEYYVRCDPIECEANTLAFQGRMSVPPCCKLIRPGSGKEPVYMYAWKSLLVVLKSARTGLGKTPDKDKAKRHLSSRATEGLDVIYRDDVQCAPSNPGGDPSIQRSKELLFNDVAAVSLYVQYGQAPGHEWIASCLRTSRQCKGEAEVVVAPAPVPTAAHPNLPHPHDLPEKYQMEVAREVLIAGTADRDRKDCRDATAWTATTTAKAADKTWKTLQNKALWGEEKSTDLLLHLMSENTGVVCHFLRDTEVGRGVMKAFAEHTDALAEDELREFSAVVRSSVSGGDYDQILEYARPLQDKLGHRILCGREAARKLEQEIFMSPPKLEEDENGICFTIEKDLGTLGIRTSIKKGLDWWACTCARALCFFQMSCFLRMSIPM